MGATDSILQWCYIRVSLCFLYFLPPVDTLAFATFTKFAGYLNWGVSFSGKEISLILKNKMAATGISLKIIYLFLLAGSHK